PFEKFIHAIPFVSVSGRVFSELAGEKIVGMWKEEGTCNDADAETIVKYLEVNVAGDCIIPEAPIRVIENKKWGPTQQYRVESNKVTEPSEFPKRSLNSFDEDIMLHLQSAYALLYPVLEF
ncbi:chalcone isomerase, partial [Tanacetum coccineum]